jgi:hypothetical protein
MDIKDDFTDAERSTLNEAFKLLGDNLAHFLFSGLGESGISHRRAFTAQSIPSHGDEVIYQLEMINDSEQGLPLGRDPLVLAALLDLLWERQPLDSTILFRECDILEKLEWPHDAESQRLIKRALERYILTAYCLIDPHVSEEERLSGDYAVIGRLLIGYETTAILRPQNKTGQPRSVKAEFWPALIHDVISGRKYFLGIEFQSLGKIQQISP